MADATSAPIVPPPDEETERLVSASMLRLRLTQPFLAALALFARYQVTREVPTAATDGLTIYVNPDFWAPLTSAQQDGLLLHEVLHAALGHCPRRGVRDPQVWNIAADIVINAMILAQPGAALPVGGMRDDRLAQFSTEEVYELLQRDLTRLPPLTLADLLPGPLGEKAGDAASMGEMRRVALEGHWRSAMQRAQTLAQTLGGSMPAGLRREIAALDGSQLDWRARLWRYVIRTPTDFAGFDRRFVGRGLYLEALEAESVRVFVCIDTSGSIGAEQLARFTGELHAIIRAYPHILCDLWYADAALHGPWRLNISDAPPAPIGGGGTDFRPFFTALEKADADPSNAVALYLTDGHGTFPAKPPEHATLWVVTPGGLSPEDFPFGETVRMLGSTI